MSATTCFDHLDIESPEMDDVAGTYLETSRQYTERAARNGYCGGNCYADDYVDCVEQVHAEAHRFGLSAVVALIRKGME